MTLTRYRTKGSRLTKEEADANMDHLADSANHSFVASGTADSESVQNNLRNRGVLASSYATPDGTTNETAGLALALAAVPTGGTLILNATSAGSTYVGTMSVRQSNINIIIPEGVSLKHPAGASGIVLELGDTASGNSATAYENINVLCDGWLDGNKANVTAPSDDLTGWGFIATKISKSYWRVKAKNCHNGGFGAVINSNYNRGSVYVESCGNATHTRPGFDINSSKYSVYDFVSKDCYDGGRVLDNCFGLQVRGTVHNATKHGFIYNNQTVNESYGNTIDVSVITCGENGIHVGLKCRTSNIRANVKSATGVGCYVIDDGTAANKSRNLTIDLTTEGCGLQGFLCYGDDCTVKHQTYLDGLTGAQGSNYAVDIYGNRNKLIVDLIDSSTWQVRGIAFRSGATANKLIAYTYTNTADPLSDSGTATDLSGLAQSTYTPAWSASGVAPAIGDGTLAGVFTRIGKRITGVIRLVAGSTTTFGTGAWTFTIPVTAGTVTNLQAGGGAVKITDDGTAYYVGAASIGSAGTTTGSIVTPGGDVSASVPHTWAQNDVLEIYFDYIAA